LGWALRQACGCAAVWPYGAITVAVSGEQLREPCVARYVAAALDESGLTPDRLELAVPESDVIDMGVDELLTLSALRDLGVGVAIDDFGGVLGSLMPLRRMPLTGLKISRTLVRGIPDDREDEAVLRAAVGLAQSVHLSVVADGIENETQRRFLSELGCDEGQGSLMGPAMLPGAFGAIL
jgi:EAL domain-containing protein (putative c-di-GMP-specific phosphodiesterase class I)